MAEQPLPWDTDDCDGAASAASRGWLYGRAEPPSRPARSR